MFSRPKILFLDSLLFVALLNSIPILTFEFLIFYHSSINKDCYKRVPAAFNITKSAKLDLKQRI